MHQSFIAPPPMINSSQSKVGIDISADIVSILDIDEISSIFHVQFFLHYSWFDSRWELCLMLHNSFIFIFLFCIFVKGWTITIWKQTLVWMLCLRRRSRRSGCPSWCSPTQRTGWARWWMMTPPSLLKGEVTTPFQTFQMWRTVTSTWGQTTRSPSADSTTSGSFATTVWAGTHLTYRCIKRWNILTFYVLLVFCRLVQWNWQWRAKVLTLPRYTPISCCTWARMRSTNMWSTLTRCNCCQRIQVR